MTDGALFLALLLLVTAAAARYHPAKNPYSVFSKFPFSWHWGHFCGLHLPSLVNPQLLHFHVAMIPSYLVLSSVISLTFPKAESGLSNFLSSPTTTSFIASGCRYFLATRSTSALVTRAMLSR